MCLCFSFLRAAACLSVFICACMYMAWCFHQPGLNTVPCLASAQSTCSSTPAFVPTMVDTRSELLPPLPPIKIKVNKPPMTPPCFHMFSPELTNPNFSLFFFA